MNRYRFGDDDDLDDDKGRDDRDGRGRDDGRGRRDDLDRPAGDDEVVDKLLRQVRGCLDRAERGGGNAKDLRDALQRCLTELRPIDRRPADGDDFDEEDLKAAEKYLRAHPEITDHQQLWRQAEHYARQQRRS